MKIDTEIGVMYPSKAKKEESKDFPLEPSEGTRNTLTLDSKVMRE